MIGSQSHTGWYTYHLHMGSIFPLLGEGGIALCHPPPPTPPHPEKTRAFPKGSDVCFEERDQQGRAAKGRSRRHPLRQQVAPARKRGRGGGIVTPKDAPQDGARRGEGVGAATRRTCGIEGEGRLIDRLVVTLMTVQAAAG